ncbi:unnamed protein product [Effrenium voratum]|uniref:SET domain-containing protein n=1 Tax=Effrenium voratum TaxID=2562239 RepID=A0AA36HXZ8_9DINO|nr:unnamed protein product [Effrenium voratum]
MEVWNWARRCCGRRHRPVSLPGAPSAYVASLRPNADAELVATWQRRLATGYWEILGDSLEEHEAGFRAKRAVSAGEAVLFEAPRACVAAGPQACDELARRVAKDREVLQLPGGRFTGEEDPLRSILSSNCQLCSREPRYVALFLKCSRLVHSCCPNAYVDSTRSHAVVRALDDLPAGAQVSVSWVPVSLCFEARKAQLGQGFACACARCAEERTEDPQLRVPCACGKATFLSEQRRCACGFRFEPAECQRHLAEACKANEFMAKDGAARGNEIQKAMALETRMHTATASKSIPPRHPQILQLANNVANCYFYAAKMPGKNQDACWEGFWKYKTQYMSGLEANHGSTKQRDLHYLLSLRRMLSAKFPTPAERLQCQEKYTSLCLLHFGEPDIPQSILLDSNVM